MIAVYMYFGGILIAFGSAAFGIVNLAFGQGSFESRRTGHGLAMLGMLFGGLLAAAGFYLGAYHLLGAFFVNMGWHWPMMGW